jgi:hypothetical protein
MPLLRGTHQHPDLLLRHRPNDTIQIRFGHVAFPPSEISGLDTPGRCFDQIARRTCSEQRGRCGMAGAGSAYFGDCSMTP